MWTKFWDMHSGGGQKAKWAMIYIEAPETEAKTIFYNRFGHNPDRVSCTCCGSDYSISESESLEDLTGYHRGCDYAYINKKTGKEIPESEAFISGKGVKRGYIGRYVERPNEKYTFKSYVTLEDYEKQPDVLVIRAAEIKASEREGEVPDEGYVWVG
jgi:hypothetical protein